jgi:hypothetical protein
MADLEYRKALDAACREWEQLAGQRADIDKRLADLQGTIATLTRLCGLTPTVPFGLADGCRVVLLRHRDQALTARRVHDELTMMGLDLSKHSSPLASIHVTLKRLVSAGQARFFEGKSGSPPRYAWTGPTKVALSGDQASVHRPWAPPVSAAASVPPTRPKGKKR